MRGDLDLDLLGGLNASNLDQEIETFACVVMTTLIGSLNASNLDQEIETRR